MTDLAEELNDIASRCEKLAARIDKDPLKSIVTKVAGAVEAVAASSTNSWIGYHSRVYYLGFRRPPAHDLFTSEWGFTSTFAAPVSENWQEVDYENVEDYILRLAGNPDLTKLENASAESADLFRRSQEEVVTILSVLLDQVRTTTIEELQKLIDLLVS